MNISELYPSGLMDAEREWRISRIKSETVRRNLFGVPRGKLDAELGHFLFC